MEETNLAVQEARPSVLYPRVPANRFHGHPNLRKDTAPKKFLLLAKSLQVRVRHPLQRRRSTDQARKQTPAATRDSHAPSLTKSRSVTDLDFQLQVTESRRFRIDFIVSLPSCPADSEALPPCLAEST